MCVSALKATKKQQEASKRLQSAEDQQLYEKIEQQDWPQVRIKKCAGVKGNGAFAGEDIKKDTLLCDYHGPLLTNEEGWRRYNEYGDNEKNSYMYQFENESKTFWIDGVVPCDCHPNKKLKGRMLNCDRKTPNVIPRIKIIHERPHILFYARRDIQKNKELLFNYGRFKDPYSAQHAWMKE